LLSPNEGREAVPWDIKVDDFDRPVAGLSPNWDVLPECLRLQDDQWEKMVLTESSLDAAHLLALFPTEKSLDLKA
jgi:hypothetical protein